MVSCVVNVGGNSDSRYIAIRRGISIAVIAHSFDRSYILLTLHSSGVREFGHVAFY